MTVAYDFAAKTVDAPQKSLADYRGKPLVVNVASKCGFTPQYAGLETLIKFRIAGPLVAGLLMAELVARETEHLEALRMQIAVESLETGVLWREAALRRDVHNQQRFAAVVGKGPFGAVDRFRGEIIGNRHVDSFDMSRGYRVRPRAVEPSGRAEPWIPRFIDTRTLYARSPIAKSFPQLCSHRALT